MSSRLRKIYDEEIKISLQEKMKYKSSMEIPAITKITINVGLGQAVKDKKVIVEQMSPQKIHNENFKNSKVKHTDFITPKVKQKYRP